MKMIVYSAGMAAAFLVFMHGGCDGEEAAGSGMDSGSWTDNQAASSGSAGAGASGAGGAGSGGGAGGGSSHPAQPSPGALIERMGRPAENTALNNAFEKNLAKKDMAKNLWNAAEPATWAALVPEVEKNLAIFDAFNAVCGDQYLAGPSAAPGRYQALASVLANDRLWVNTDETTCTTYLAVETNTSGDCGGRALYYDVIDATYSMLISGKSTGIGDAVNKGADVDGAVFPYLAAPNP